MLNSQWEVGVLPKSAPSVCSWNWLGRMSRPKLRTRARGWVRSGRQIKMVKHSVIKISQFFKIQMKQYF